ncbi:MAG: DNA translocase FtsK [Oscillospiraceae bacterium]|nr:DNA translocase FtsK [Oscillospiraceae bacterium]
MAKVPAKKKTTTKKPPNKQSKSIILSALGLLIFVLALFEGDSGWAKIHHSLYGLFGWCFIILGPLLMYISVIIIRPNQKISIIKEVVQGFILLLLLCSMTHVFQFANVNFKLDWKEQITAFYNQGAKNGGVAGGIFTLPLVKFCGLWGTGVTIGILILVFIMLVMRITIADIFHFLKDKNVKKLDIEPSPLNNMRSDKNWLQEIAKEVNEQKKPAVPQENLPPDLFNWEDLPFEMKQENQEKFLKQVKKKRHTAKISEIEPILPMMETSDIDGYELPSLELLNCPKPINMAKLGDELKITAGKLIDTLKSFGVGATIVDISKGPSVTRYELQPSVGIKISKITGLADDIALNLATAGVRIEAPIPNKAAIGIEVPNKKTGVVNIREVIESEAFVTSKSKLTIALGKDISGDFTIADLAKMPHTLIAGATGAGKSVCINSIIISLIFKSSPNDVKLLMIDPKVVELGIYNGIPHLLVPVVTEPRKAAGALGWAVCEMLNRYKLFAENSVRDLESYNKLAKLRADIEKLPQIVIIIDELADLMMVAPNEVEDSICRLAQMARAAGMHLVIATQRPSVDVITGIIKANIPSRIAFSVSSQVDSRTILDSSGAEKLLGRGDMLFLPVGVNKPIRVQGCFVTDKEVEHVVEFIKQKREVDYNDEVAEEIEKYSTKETKEASNEHDEMLDSAIKCVVETGQASTSLLQRKLKIGYSRAARLMDEMEEDGIIAESDGSRPRKVKISKREWLEIQNRKDL